MKTTIEKKNLRESKLTNTVKQIICIVQWYSCYGDYYPTTPECWTILHAPPHQPIYSTSTACCSIEISSQLKGIEAIFFRNASIKAYCSFTTPNCLTDRKYPYKYLFYASRIVTNFHVRYETCRRRIYDTFEENRASIEMKAISDIKKWTTQKKKNK